MVSFAEKTPSDFGITKDGIYEKSLFTEYMRNYSFQWNPMWKRIKNLVDEKLFRPFRESQAPESEIGLGTVVGLFWGLTPLVGIQMWLVSITWFFLRIFKIRTNLAIGLALVWITNPVTMPFFYYTFYITGVYLFEAVGISVERIDFHLFERTLSGANSMGVKEGLLFWAKFMVADLGWPMLAGSFAMGIPAAVAGYPLSILLIRNYRKKKINQGM